MQVNIFSYLYPKYKITKPIRLIEMFSGYGSQALALKYLGVQFEYWRTCEWAIKSIQSYKDIHFKKITANPSLNYDLKFLIDYLFKKGISSNYNVPMRKEQIKKLGEQQIRNIYNNIQITNNLVNIQQVNGEELGIVDKDKYTYLFTYSFPCQDLSLAGKRAGMSDTSTRSGMLWEVERILDECNKLNQLPDVLLMENVPQVHSKENLNDFNKWKYKLETLGYKNYFQDLIGIDYGIPQTRNRCFMVSILGDYSYTFPKPIPLKLRLKDMLENNVDEKYYLTNKQISDIQKWNAYEKPLEHIQDEIRNTLTTRSDAYCSGMQLVGIKIPEATKQGYAIANDGDGVYINRPYQKRGVVQKEKIQTIKTSVDDIGVVVIGNYSPSNHNASRIIDSEYSAPTVMENHGTITATLTNDLRIRKLTPKECGRLMGVRDEDIDKLTLSDSAKYHCFGDSIIVDVLMAIFKEMI